MKDGSLCWLIFSGVIYQLVFLVLSSDIRSNEFISLIFLFNSIYGLYIIFRLRVKELKGFEWIHPSIFTGLGFSTSFATFLAMYSRGSLDLGWIIFLVLALKIAFDLIGIEVKVNLVE